MNPVHTYIFRQLNTPGAFTAVGSGSIGNITLAQAVRQAQEGGGGNAADTTTYTAHNSLVMIVHWSHATVTLSSVTVSGESAPTEAGTDLNIIGNQHHRIFYLGDITAGGSKTITATWSGVLSGQGNLIIVELSSTNTIAFLGQAGNTSGSGALASIALTTATDKEFGLATVQCDTQEPTVTAGFTVIALANTNLWDEGEYNLNLGSAGSKTLSMNTAGAWGIKACTFKASGS